MASELIALGRRVLLQEAQTLEEVAKSLDSAFEAVARQVLAAQGVVLLTGMGKSGIIARKWASTFSSTGTRAYFVDPAEASHGELGVIRRGDILIALSFSGETSELTAILAYAREGNVPIVAVTGNPKSSLAKYATTILAIPVRAEACPLNLAPTSSTTAMMAIGDALAVSLMLLRDFKAEEFAKLHPGGSLGRRLNLKVSDIMHQGDALPRVAPTTRLPEVLLEMTRKSFGITVVCEGEKVVGVITDGDLRRFFQSDGLNPEANAAQLMTRNPKSVNPDAMALAARTEMERNSIQQLLVVEGERLVGLLHFHDLLRSQVL